MSIIELTDSQAEALRILRGVPAGLRLGKGTDANVGTINGRVAKALAGHGLALVREYDTFGEPCDPLAVVTQEGHGWVLSEDAGREVLSDTGLGEGVEDGEADTPSPETSEKTSDPAMASVDCELCDTRLDIDADLYETVMGFSEDSLVAIATNMLNKHRRIEEGEDFPELTRHDVEPLITYPADLDDKDEERFDGRVIDGWITKVTGGMNHYDSRHLGDRIVLVVEGHISNVSGKLGEDGLVREQTVKVGRISTLPTDIEQPLNRYIAAIRTSGEDSLFDDSDTARADLVARLNRDELEVRDDKGRREFDDEADEPDDETDDPAGDLLAEAEEQRPQAIIRSKVGAMGYEAVLPKGYEDLDDVWMLPEAAFSAVDKHLGVKLEWRQSGTDLWVADLPVAEVDLDMEESA